MSILTRSKSIQIKEVPA
uniref:Uncharacterized protein n=1 Tax=Lepeophtheirus salmonis TaxID=72036 RepID=A0A0K2UYG2_LEPSM